MSKSIRHILSVLFIFCLATSCNPTRNLVYFSDLAPNESYKTTAGTESQLRIQANDLLGIRINSMSNESNALFNRGVMQTTTTAVATASSITEAVTTEGYAVDNNGEIDFPVLGKVKLAGLTVEEATTLLTTKIGQYVKSPIVTVRLLNFRVTVIGEVNRPATFTVPTERINVLEALGLAGDMTAYGKRENVLLLREKNGVRTTTRLNLNSKSLLGSPYFYLQQNDVLYVEPSKIREVQASTNQRSLAIYAMVVSVLVALAFNLRF